MKFVVVEHFESYDKTSVEAETKEEAVKKIYDDEEHHGDIIDCYEVKE